ncbi:hypothetical protein ACR77J_07970 [Tissierella praeacuta]|uniref:hypothetical protein n=1 Tax=Tissierella praeacuta TaxID=43131 RepID=UPI003DA36E6B
MIKICNYCGYCQENDEDRRCECGGSFIYDNECIEYYSWERDKVMSAYEGDLHSVINNVDNILEWKRSKSKVNNK